MKTLLRNQSGRSVMIKVVFLISLFGNVVLYAIYHQVFHQLYNMGESDFGSTLLNSDKQLLKFVTGIPWTSRSIHFCGPINELSVPLTMAKFLGLRIETQMDKADLIWSYHCKWNEIKSQLRNIHFDQRLNKIPGSDGIVKKAILSTRGYPFVPKGFLLPRDEQAMNIYLQDNPKKKFLRKSSFHGGVSLYNPNGTSVWDDNEILVQELVEDLLLLDGRKFDLTAYVLITSVNPLRVYINKRWLVRMSQVKYLEFESNPWSYSTDSYVIVALKSHMNSLGIDAEAKFQKVKDIIVELLMENLPRMREGLRDFPKSGSSTFFQLMRWDFLLDSRGDPHLIEVNGSPYFGCVDSRNIARMNRVFFNALRILDMVPIGPDHSKRERDFVMPIDVTVNPEETNQCLESCHSHPQCKLSFPCMEAIHFDFLSTVMIENQNMGEYERLFPLPVKANSSTEHLQGSHPHLSSEDLFLRDWFKGKCQLDKAFCA
ncbi:probable tubulin polyglutamylase ttll-15 isoform X1 [Tigriopus californicus]|uniref:probable tubulin polyglutamylase ttll-15 isoform X1 n=1 Tax=Tigriopus californicus TaxID=6832 RepID=UPI0027D9DB59|nr:probable tubulin polyglutamylase ttll-15 isoform X1 [Tigriopus californicus]